MRTLILALTIALLPVWALAATPNLFQVWGVGIERTSFQTLEEALEYAETLNPTDVVWIGKWNDDINHYCDVMTTLGSRDKEARALFFENFPGASEELYQSSLGEWSYLGEVVPYEFQGGTYFSWIGGAWYEYAQFCERIREIPTRKAFQNMFLVYLDYQVGIGNEEPIYANFKDLLANQWLDDAWRATAHPNWNTYNETRIPEFWADNKNPEFTPDQGFVTDVPNEVEEAFNAIGNGTELDKSAWLILLETEASEGRFSKEEIFIRLVETSALVHVVDDTYQKALAIYSH
jgi:hypothetical protein